MFFSKAVSNFPRNWWFQPGTAAEKALAVNLDAKFYGSFAEIGAGQEVGWVGCFATLLEEEQFGVLKLLC